MVKKTFPVGAFMEQALPKPNKINEGKIKENTVNLVFCGRKKGKGEENHQPHLQPELCNEGPKWRGPALRTFLLRKCSLQFFVLRPRGFALGIAGLPK